MNWERTANLEADDTAIVPGHHLAPSGATPHQGAYGDHYHSIHIVIPCYTHCFHPWPEPPSI